MRLTRALVVALACGTVTLLVVLNATVGSNSTLQQVLRSHAHTHTHTPPRTSTFIQEGSSNVRYFSKTKDHLLTWGVRAMEKALGRIAAQDKVKAAMANETDTVVRNGIRHRRELIRRKFRICVIQNLLLQVLNALKGCGIPHCVEGGTLMGFWRHGGIMPWDSDADVMFFGGPDDVEPMVRCLRDSPAFDSSVVIVATTLKKHKGGLIPVKVAHAGSGLYVDVWGPAVNDTNTRTVSYADGIPGGVQDIDTVFPLRTETYRHVPFPIPVPARVRDFVFGEYPGSDPSVPPEGNDYDREVKELEDVELFGECVPLLNVE